MQKFKYTGDDPVDVPALGLVEVTKGTHIEVSDPDLAAGLHGQPQWEHIPDKKRSRTAKKAASKRTAAKKTADAPATESAKDEPVPVATSNDSQEG